jgi:hypothetical protein
MRDGRFRIVTVPLSTVTVTGYGAATAGFVPATDDAVSVSVSATTASAAARAKRPDMAASPSPFREGVEAEGERQVF